MRKSNQYFTQDSQQPKHFRGGEQKVMKKSLSLLVAIAMVFSMFASVAFAADAAVEKTTQEKFDELKAAGIFTGYPGGGAGLTNEMTRAEFAKVLAKVTQLTDNAAAAKIYSDVVASHWAVGQIGSVTEAGFMSGIGAGKFGPTGKVTLEQVAKVATLVAGISQVDKDVTGTVSPWAKGYVAAAIDAGLLTEVPSYQVNATRGVLVEVAYDLYDVKPGVLKATGAKQTGAKKITVTFNQAVTDADKAALTYELKYSLTPYPVTPEYATDGKSVVLSAAYLPAGDFTLTVKGSDAISLKVEAEKATKIDVTVPALTYADSVDLGVKVYNQFSEEMTNAGPTISVYNVTKSKNVPVNGTQVNLKTGDVAAIGDSINVTAVLPSAGLSVNKTLKVINGSAATSIKIDQVQPLAGKTRISVGETGLVLPLSLVDVNGQAIKLPYQSQVILANGAHSFDLGGLIFYVSDTDIINNIAVDPNGVVTFNTKANSGTAYITITNGATGATATTSVVVNGVSELKELQLQHPGKPIVKGEAIVFPFTALDTFGAAIAGKDLVMSQVSFYGPQGLTVAKNAKGELEFTFANTGSYTVYTLVKGIQQATTVQVTVGDSSYFTAVNGVKDVATTYEVGASNDFDVDNITIVDNYGRVSNVAAGTYTVTPDDPNVVSYTGGKLVAGNAAGSTTVTVHSNANTNIADYKFTVNVVASSDIKTFAISDIGTIYGKDTLTGASKYAKAVTLVGKTASGTTVALKNSNANAVTTSDESVIALSGNNTIYGLKAGKSTIAAYNANNVKVAELEVTVSDAVPTAKTAAFSASEYTTAGTVTVSVEVKDQYGVVITPDSFIASSDTTIATVSSITKTATAITATVTKVKTGFVTLNFVSSNGTTATATVVVN
ncbi:S-layer homology domain-containing protein [Paenibacillus solisilvae]|uniref:S-layer homology domain-containing protein n=1 Tax=Paenibacillus solisilvae TaxID=2486751 RepID=A0ABW0W9R3_9BACL